MTNFFYLTALLVSISFNTENCRSYDSGECTECNSGYELNEATSDVSSVPTYKSQVFSFTATRNSDKGFNSSENCKECLQFSFLELQDVQGAHINIKSVSCLNCSNPGNEGPKNILQQNNDKMVDKNFKKNNNNTRIKIKLHSEAAIASYKFRTGNDFEGRDPTAWTIYNPVNEKIDQRSNQQFTKSRNAQTSKQVVFDHNSLKHKQCVPKPDWVATCYQNRTTFLTDDNLPNCLVTADFGTTKECYKCATGQTYDEKYQCITLADAETQGVCTSLTGVPAGTDECSQCDAGKGNTCVEGTVLVSDGTCVPEIFHCDNYECDGTCLECLNGQYLAQDENVCVTAIPHCVDQESSGACLNCQSDYVEVADDVCCASIQNCQVQAATCAEDCLQICDGIQIENNNHVCVDEIQDCANYQDDGACHQCEKGYQVATDNDKVCVAEQPNCAEYLESGVCQTCGHGHILVTHASASDRCALIIPDCGDYDYETGHCQGCIDGQELAYDDDVCVPRIDNCSVYYSSGDCFECAAEQLGLSHVTCHEKIPQCTSYTCKGGCETCTHGYVQLAGECSPAIPQCNTQNKSSGDCAECISGQTLSNSQCTDTKNCASYNCDSACVECLNGYTLHQNGDCTG